MAVGQRIYNIGYPHFNPLRDSVRDLRPTIFEGRLIKCNPALLISDGTVLCGQSGGPMLDEHGLLVGVCVSNIKWKNHIYPNLNSSVPLAAIIRTIEQFARNEGKWCWSLLLWISKFTSRINEIIELLIDFRCWCTECLNCTRIGAAHVVAKETASDSFKQTLNGGKRFCKLLKTI